MIKPWTDRQVAKLRECAAADMPASAAAKLLGRSYGATRQKALYEGIRFKSLGKRHSQLQRKRWKK